MKNRFESETGQEQMDKPSKVIMHFFRHAEQERDPNKSNQAFELTNKGRGQAIEKGKTIGAQNLNQAVAFGSPRKRAQQTSAYAMAGKSLDTITGSESLEELKEKIDKDLKVGSKIGSDPRLDFYLDKNSAFGSQAYEAVFEKKNYLKFLVEKSDKLALETNDKLASTYSRQAGSVAKIVKKYTSVSNSWNKLVKKGTYEDKNLERFLGSHGGVVESFLLKVIEKIKGTEERNRLLSLMPNQFDYTEGMDISIANDGQSQIAHLSFKKVDPANPEKNFVFEEDIPAKIIDEIIQETGE